MHESNRLHDNPAICLSYTPNMGLYINDQVVKESEKKRQKNKAKQNKNVVWNTTQIT